MSKHQKELKGIKRLHSSGPPGACIHRHGNSKVRANDYCSYRWQGLLNAIDNAGFYNYPAYRKLVGEEGVKTDKARGFPSWYKRTLKAPQKGEWNVTEIVGAKNQKNFRDKCYKPYWHEAHHIVPDDVLRQTLAWVGEGAASPAEVEKTIRAGLLEEKYNLNAKINMFLLPMDTKISETIGLPKHRITTTTRNHTTYSDKVFAELKKILTKLKKATQKHDEFKYSSCKEGIENQSNILRAQIRAAGELDKVASLDQMADARFQPPGR
jgi:A nuclease family of the HNH/ENDO VII superfamily with conserved AHH